MSATSLFHLDQPADLAAVPAGTVLRGWAVGRDGYPLVDLRARLAGAVWPVAYGFLRPDLAAHFQTRQPELPAGFEARLPLTPGVHPVAFEARDITGQWQTLASLTFTVTGSATNVPAPAPVVIRPREFAALLRRRLRQGATSSAAATVAALPVPAAVLYPPPGFRGHLHQPELLESTVFGRLYVEGWLFHESRAIRRLTATVDLQASQVLGHAEPLPYVAAHFPDIPFARAAKFSGLVDVPTPFLDGFSLRIYAELDDDSRHLCLVQRAAATELEEEKRPFALTGRLGLARAAFGLRRACQARGWSVPVDRAWWREWRGLGREVRVQPPVRAAAPPMTVPTSTRLPNHVTLITHNLNYEGAPLFLLEFARHLASQEMGLRVLSGQPGPLGAEFTALGAEVRLLDMGPLHAAATPAAFRSALRWLAQAPDVKYSDLFVANTLSAHWGVHLAHLAGRPSLFYIHESTTPARFYHGHASPALLPVATAAFTRATHVSFLTEATRRYYAPLLRRSNHSLNPGWIDVGRIDAFLAAHPRAGLRQQLELADATRLVVNLGTVCDRKGQHLFVRAVDLLWQRHPELAATARFAMVGGRDTLFDRMLRGLVADLAYPNLVIVPEIAEPLTHLGAADVFVCSSYEESWPRVVLEAMACSVPVLSTDVHGIPEMIRADTDGVLVPPGDAHRLAEGLARLLADPAAGQRRAESARARVVELYDARRLLPRHAALACGLAAGGR